jgi:hypothetical protein
MHASAPTFMNNSSCITIQEQQFMHAYSCKPMQAMQFMNSNA